MNKRIIGIIGLFLWVFITAFAQKKSPALSGKIITKEKEEVPFATVYLKGTNYGCATNEEGLYHLVAPEGDYTLVVSAVGYETVEKPIQLVGERQKMNIVLSDSEVQLDEVVIMADGVSRVNRSAFNAVAIGTRITAIGWIPLWSSSMPTARQCSTPPWRSMCSVSTMPITTRR